MDTFNLDNPEKPTIAKHPQDVMDYSVSFAAWLGADTIQTITITPESPLAVAGQSHALGVVTGFLSGGTPGRKHRAQYKIVTNGGRTKVRSIYLAIREL